MLKESSERNSSREFLDALQPEFLQNRPATGQEDFCNEVSIELLPIQSNRQNSDSDFKVENPWESREPPRFFWPSGSFASFRNDKLTMRQKVAEAEGWWVGQRRRVNGVEEALINDRSALAFIPSSCSPFSLFFFSCKSSIEALLVGGLLLRKFYFFNFYMVSSCSILFTDFGTVFVFALG